MSSKMFKSQSLVSVNAILFGIRLLADVIMSRGGHAGGGSALSPVVRVLIEQRKIGNTEETQGEGHVRICKHWRDMGRAKEQQRLLGATKNLGRGKDRSSPRAFRGSMDLPTP